MPVVTISRETGSGGSFIALKLAEALGGTSVDKEIIHEIAQKMGRDQEDLKDFDQDSYNRISVFFQEALAGIAQGGHVFHPFGIGPLDWDGVNLFHPYPEQDFNHQEYSDVLRQVILDLAKKNNVVILGRGGQVILRNQPDVLHLRLVAERPDRIKRLMEEQKLDEEKALALLEQRDESAQKFLADFFDVDWNDPHLYHLSLNTSLVPLSEALPIILRTMGR